MILSLLLCGEIVDDNEVNFVARHLWSSVLQLEKKKKETKTNCDCIDFHCDHCAAEDETVKHSFTWRLSVASFGSTTSVSVVRRTPQKSIVN